MSDAGTTTAAAPAAASTGANTGTIANANTGTPSAAQSAAPETSGTEARETKAETQERILAESDLDAFIVQKINGKEEKVRVRDLQKAYGLDKTANQRLQEAALIRKQQQQLAHWFNNEPDKFFEATGTNRDEWLRKNLSSRKEIAEEILAAEYERQQMDPHQREALEYKEKLAKFEAQETARKTPLINEIKRVVPESQLPKGLDQATPEQLQQFLQVKQQEFQAGLDNLSNELLGAWEKNGLPKQKEFGQWMAQVMSDHQKRTGEALHPDQAAAKVKSRFLDSTRSLLSQMDAKAIQETLGEAILQKLREHDVQRVTASGPQFGQKNDQAPPAVNEQPKKAMTELEFRRWAGIR